MNEALLVIVVIESVILFLICVNKYFDVVRDRIDKEYDESVWKRKIELQINDLYDKHCKRPRTDTSNKK